MSELEEDLSVPKEEKVEHRLYTKWRPRMEYVKITLQMLIGVFIMIFTFYHLYLFVFRYNDIRSMVHTPTLLHGISYGLFAYAGIEIGYSFFVNGVGEAVKPLITTISAIMLIVLDGTTNKESISCVFMLLIALWFVFFLNRKYIENRSSGCSMKNIKDLFSKDSDKK
ncbi:hypothetical protein K4L44_04590 [Halosquirtibacter laminarini]|uniref:Uncharacterized protein n=1 Tax=Halosquirtibacter laminarini TaxID=3374600 RepID=A0AC61NHH6_9BACT|nr:hypothetical protein K4L44_04590 [Prolixibacteraceae bacterium]